MCSIKQQKMLFNQLLHVSSEHIYNSRQEVTIFSHSQEHCPFKFQHILLVKPLQTNDSNSKMKKMHCKSCCFKDILDLLKGLKKT